MAAETLRDTVVGILDDFQVPVPTSTVRIVASARRGQEVNATALSRLASAQRDEFLRSRRAPALCHTIDRNAKALRPRVWARGEWRLGRRIATTDAIPGWQAILAGALCSEALRHGGAPPRPLADVALEAIARVVGPIATYLPGSIDEWTQLRREVAGSLPPLGPASQTSQQLAAEQRFKQHEPEPSALVLYFGATDDAPLTAGRGEPSLIRLPGEGEEGEPFDEILRRRVGGHPARHRDLVAYLQGYSHMLDEIDRGPSTDEFADYWRFSLESVRGDEALFREAFPEESSPEALLRLLERGLPRNGALAWLLGVRVLDAAPQRYSGVLPAAGQRWVQADGSALTVVDSDTDQLTVALHRQGTTALSVMPRSALAGWELDVASNVWRVVFDVNVVPATLLEALQASGIVADRLARPGDPRPNRSVLAVGTVEAHLVAADAEAARGKVTQALREHVELQLDEIFVHPLPRNAIIN